jgi:hypothetical protein
MKNDLKAFKSEFQAEKVNQYQYALNVLYHVLESSKFECSKPRQINIFKNKDK